MQTLCTIANGGTHTSAHSCWIHLSGEKWKQHIFFVCIEKKNKIGLQHKCSFNLNLEKIKNPFNSNDFGKIFYKCYVHILHILREIKTLKSDCIFFMLAFKRCYTLLKVCLSFFKSHHSWNLIVFVKSWP